MTTGRLNPSNEVSHTVAVRYGRGCGLASLLLRSVTRVLTKSILQVSDDKQYDWVARYESVIRVVPLGIGLVGTVGVLLNRFLSQVRIQYG